MVNILEILALAEKSIAKTEKNLADIKEESENMDKFKTIYERCSKARKDLLEEKHKLLNAILQFIKVNPMKKHHDKAPTYYAKSNHYSYTFYEDKIEVALITFSELPASSYSHERMCEVDIFYDLCETMIIAIANYFKNQSQDTSQFLELFKKFKNLLKKQGT